MAGNIKTPGDVLFEQFLARSGRTFIREPDLVSELGLPGQTRPDYLVRHGGKIAVCEVKHFGQETALGRRMMRQRTVAASNKEVFGPVRSQVRDAARQLRPLKQGRVPLVIVLSNPLNVTVDLSPFNMIHALLGDAQHVITFDQAGAPLDERPQVGRDGVLLRERRYISAVAVVYSSADAADVYEVADKQATPLPRDLFDLGRGLLHGYLPGQRYGQLPD